jgi:hypothetical protein
LTIASASAYPRDVGVSFEIQYVSPDGRTVVARQLDPGPFAWPEGTTLGGLPIARTPGSPDVEGGGGLGPFVFARRGPTLGGVAIVGASVPRALDAEGRQRTDLFGFALKGPIAVRMHVGEVVELSSP